MRARHFEVLVEEPSMEAFLGALLPRMLPDDVSFQVHPFQGKTDLLDKVPARLRAYASWLPADWRILVVVDRDDDDCGALKQTLEGFAGKAGLLSRSRSVRSGQWQLVNRIAVEELEAWYFGDWEAVRAAYPRVAATVPQRQGFRDPDAIAGGTWEAFERVMQQHGYFRTGLPKIEVARTLGDQIEPERTRSNSFLQFYLALAESVV